MPAQRKFLLRSNKLCLFSFFIALAIFLFWTEEIFAQNLLQNPGFEEGISSWSKYGGTFEAIGDHIHNGTEAARLVSMTDSTKWIYQVVPVTGGTAYLFSGYLIKNSPNISSALLRIAWYSSSDGGGPELSHTDSTDSLTEDSSEYRFLSTGAVIAPDDANSARAKAVVAFTSKTQTYAYFDDFTFEETDLPTPTPTPIPTEEPGEEPSPSPTPSPSPSPSPRLTPSPSPKPTKTPEATLSGEILGEESSPAGFYPWEATEEGKTQETTSLLRNKFISKLFLSLGLIFLFASAFWIWYNFLKERQE